MDRTTASDGVARSAAARIGVTLLNLPAPGLGLLRVGGWRPALALLFAPSAAMLAFAAAAQVLPAFSVTGFWTWIVFLLLVQIAILAIAAIATWRASATISLPRPRFAHGLVLVAAYFLTVAALTLSSTLLLATYRPYSTPSESMLPTLQIGDVAVADMRRHDAPAIGDLVVYDHPAGAPFVKRVAALGGDRIALVDGVPIRNGVAASHRQVGVMAAGGVDNAQARLIEERLVGDHRTHRILDGPDTMLDQFPETTVPPGHLFMLGDNRDNSADSRLPTELNGSGMVPAGSVRGEMRFLRNLVPADRFGLPLDR